MLPTFPVNYNRLKENNNLLKVKVMLYSFQSTEYYKRGWGIAGMYDGKWRSGTGKSSARRSGFWIVAVVVIIAAAALGIFSRMSGGVSPLQLLREKLPFGIAVAHNVSQNTSEYIQAEDTVSTQLGYVMSLADDELSETGENCYDSCAEEIRKLLDCISAMNDIHITSSSPLTEYEEYCSTYYSYVAGFFVEIQRNGTFTWNEYRTLFDWSNETVSPYEKLKEVFDANGVTYTIKYHSNGTEFMEYEISDLGVH